MFKIISGIPENLRADTIILNLVIFYRKNHSTIDHIFVMKALLDIYSAKKRSCTAVLSTIRQLLTRSGKPGCT